MKHKCRISQKQVKDELFHGLSCRGGYLPSFECQKERDKLLTSIGTISWGQKMETVSYPELGHCLRENWPVQGIPIQQLFIMNCGNSHQCRSAGTRTCVLLTADNPGVTSIITTPSLGLSSPENSSGFSTKQNGFSRRDKKCSLLQAWFSG